jgi:hypothetical protein
LHDFENLVRHNLEAGRALREHECLVGNITRLIASSTRVRHEEARRSSPTRVDTAHEALVSICAVLELARVDKEVLHIVADVLWKRPTQHVALVPHGEFRVLPVVHHFIR